MDTMSKKKKQSDPDPLAAVRSRRSDTCIGIGVPDGWVSLMVELDAALVAVCPDIRYEQVKEKWAELRVYVSHANDAARELIRDAELRSRTICERCGEEGAPCKGRGWYRALCPSHADELGYTVVESS